MQWTRPFNLHVGGEGDGTLRFHVYTLTLRVPPPFYQCNGTFVDAGTLRLGLEEVDDLAALRSYGYSPLTEVGGFHVVGWLALTFRSLPVKRSTINVQRLSTYVRGTLSHLAGGRWVNKGSENGRIVHRKDGKMAVLVK